MSPQEQWEMLRDVGPFGALLAAAVSVLNLALVAWWKNQEVKSRGECQTQRDNHNQELKALYDRIHQDGIDQTMAREKAISALRDYVDDERHNLREWMQAQHLTMEARVAQLEADNRACAKDRRELEVLARGLRK